MPDNMKISCGVARDLMSLEGGGRYPDQTRPILQRHLEECPDCARLYAETKRAAPVEAVDAAAAEDFRIKSEKMKRKNPMRVSLKAAALALAALLLVGAGVFAFIFLSDTRFDIPLGDYDAELLQTAEGWPYFRVTYHAPVAGFVAADVYNVDEQGILTLCGKKSLIGKPINGTFREKTGYAQAWLVNQGGRLYAYRYEEVDMEAVGENGVSKVVSTLSPVLIGELKEIRKAVSGAYEIVWRAGDGIPVSNEYRPNTGLTEEQTDALLAEIE